MKPPYQGPGFVLWAAPALVFAGLGLFAFFYIRRRLGAPLPPPPELSEEDAARVRAARAQD
jgi:cytochrome c-type biogenesis protein CcmH/NrfF